MNTPAGNLYQIKAPHLCAGAIERNGRFIHAAPILRWTVGKTLAEVQAYAKRKGWQMTKVDAAAAPDNGGGHEGASG